MVPPPPSGAALAPRPGPVPGLGRGGPPPADTRRAGGPVLRAVRARVPHGPRARARARGPGPEGLAGSRLLCPCPPPPRRGPPDREDAGGSLPFHRSRARDPSGRRPVHRPRRRGDRVRPARGRARGERAAGRRPLDSRGRGPTRPARPRSTRAGPRFDPAPNERRRVQRGGHGARGDGLSAGPTGLPGVPGRVRVPRASRARGPGGVAEARGPRAPAPCGGRGRRSRGPGSVARPAPSAGRSPAGSLGIPGRDGGPRRAPRDRGSTGTANGHGPRRAPPRPARDRPARLQPLHGGAVRLRRPLPGKPRSGDRDRPALGDRVRARPPSRSEGDREGPGARGERGG